MSDDKRSRYSTVYRRLWTDARFMALSTAPPNGQTLFQRLLTGPELTNIPGVFMAGEAGLAEALGWSLEGFREAFAEVFRQGLAKADWRARFVFIPKAIRHNKPQSPNVVRSWRIAWDELPECALKVEARRTLRAFVEGMGKGFAEAFAEACPEPSPNQDQDQDQDQDPPKAPPASRPVTMLPTENGVSDQAPPRIVDVGTAAMYVVVDAYIAAVSEASGRTLVATYRIAERTTLADAVNGHLRGDGTITSALVALREAVAEWVDEYRDKPGIAAGWAPRKFLDWLNAERHLAADSPDLPPVESPPAPVIRPTMSAEKRRSNMARIAELEADGFGGKFVG